MLIHPGDDRFVEFEAHEVFKFTPHWERVLRDRTLGFSKIGASNDPFEGQFHLRIHETKKRAPADIADDDEWWDRAKGLMGLMREKIERASATSMSRTPYASLMWSHYASRHEGVCFCLDYRRLYEGRRVYWDDVTYSSQLPHVDFYAGETTEQQLTIACRHALLTKSLDWSYEKEFRIIPLASDSSSRGFGNLSTEDFSRIPFHPDALKGVIVGYKTPDDVRTNLRRTVREYKDAHGVAVPVVYALPSGINYSMVVRSSPHRRPAAEQCTGEYLEPGSVPMAFPLS